MAEGTPAGSRIPFYSGWDGVGKRRRSEKGSGAKAGEKQWSALPGRRLSDEGGESRAQGEETGSRGRAGERGATDCRAVSDKAGKGVVAAVVGVGEGGIVGFGAGRHNGDGRLRESCGGGGWIRDSGRSGVACGDAGDAATQDGAAASSGAEVRKGRGGGWRRATEGVAADGDGRRREGRWMAARRRGKGGAGWRWATEGELWRRRMDPRGGKRTEEEVPVGGARAHSGTAVSHDASSATAASMAARQDVGAVASTGPSTPCTRARDAMPLAVAAAIRVPRRRAGPPALRPYPEVDRCGVEHVAALGADDEDGGVGLKLRGEALDEDLVGVEDAGAMELGRDGRRWHRGLSAAASPAWRPPDSSPRSSAAAAVRPLAAASARLEPSIPSPSSASTSSSLPSIPSLASISHSARIRPPQPGTSILRRAALICAPYRTEMADGASDPVASSRRRPTAVGADGVGIQRPS
uniref:Uncharacterized protein n=1 Tax=Setaria viridis TaxID=4556 RepID=A0A4U6T759_SETVI|nr:hypothetical protein SEVIR_9G468800v2 [Setaria viridis]